MSDSILVIVEQRESKLKPHLLGNHHRRSGNRCCNRLDSRGRCGWRECCVYCRRNRDKESREGLCDRSAKLEPYTPDAFAAALKQFLTANQSKLVLMPHTYQVRDFVPKLATAWAARSSAIALASNTKAASCIHAANVSG